MPTTYQVEEMQYCKLINAIFKESSAKRHAKPSQSICECNSLCSPTPLQPPQKPIPSPPPTITLLLHHKPQKRPSHPDPIVVLLDPPHSILISPIIKNPPIMPILQQLRHDILIKLRMPLSSYQSFPLIHALNMAAWRVTQVFDRGRIGVDCVLVHLVNGL